MISGDRGTVGGNDDGAGIHNVVKVNLGQQHEGCASRSFDWLVEMRNEVDVKREGMMMPGDTQVYM